MPAPGQLFIGLVAGAIGLGYFVYGKREGRFAPMLCGIALCVYPYLVAGTLWLCLVGAALLAAPFLVDF
ncbi:MAG TPA: hypothetical protein VFL12_07705 [Thermoanaerobaculia bacterium]|nr:hypothetical protein [Thermoanaerobaculia bacterium]